MTLKEITSCPGYVVSDYGFVFSRKHGELTQLEPRTDSMGFRVVDLRANGICKTEMIHKLVATEFVANPDGLKEVCHINGDQTDNSAQNLKWADTAESRTPAIWTREVILIDLETENSKTFNSLQECAEFLGCDSSTVYHAIRNCRKFAKHFVADYTGFEVCRNKKNEIIIKRRID